ncbi:uncharacterized protein CG3556-like [Centruroides sculpturatus]|uniref:uncharacterized protein CG3556-like n=1 Tax=Centruroides sculpturatus TaxID=218467 RepID=UPI000C6C9E3B|nr:uncharacterized protein CG3556-like [Centruroides sculpturatus]
MLLKTLKIFYEKKEDYRIEDIPGVRESTKRGLSWLLKQRRSDWGWGKDTSRAIVTLRLSDSLNFDLNESQLMLKQLKLQLSATLLTKSVEDIEAYEIASYVHSLLAICSDPRNFQGYDLVELLKEKIKKTKSINPMVALAICNSNQTLSSRQKKNYKKVQIEGYRIEDIPGVRESTKRGLSWLLNQRRSDWGWGKDTSRVIVTLRLSDSLNFDLHESQLMLKQLKLQLSATLFTKGVENIEAYEIASYVHSLLAICSDPRNFQGYDLVELLKEKMEKTKSINAMVALSICNSNETLLSRQVRKLEETALIIKNSPYSIDTRSYAIMALWCMENRIKLYQINSSTDETFKYNRKIPSFSAITEQLTTLQNEDGSFGNLHTTAILMHALFSVDLNFSIAEEQIVTKAINYIISQQNQDGSFGDSLATYLILPILNRKTFVDLGKLKCSMVEPRWYLNFFWYLQFPVTMQEEIDSKKLPKHRVSYFIFVGQDKDIIFNILLNVPVNSTFYDVMRLASELDNKFRFKYNDYTWGKYIYMIFGLVNDPEKKTYWQLYKKVDNSTIYFEQSPDKVIPEENDVYVYWYKPLND